MKLESYSYEGEALSRVYENEKWTVGIKNWKPANDPMLINSLERHHETDELFILLAGRGALVYVNESDGGLALELVEMEPMRVYNISKNLWHNTITWKNTKLALIEDSSTGMVNSEQLQLQPEQIKQLRNLLGI
jgi:ureidoglycolate hydrolase